MVTWSLFRVSRKRDVEFLESRVKTQSPERKMPCSSVQSEHDSIEPTNLSWQESINQVKSKIYLNWPGPYRRQRSEKF